MSANINSYIQSKLLELEEQEEMKILIAVESGSRAWGFPSRDSDYDIRFIYVRKTADYLSLQERRDVIETPAIHDPVLDTVSDMNGWDLKKALKLACKPNPVATEWLSSPIIYASVPQFADAFKEFIRHAFNPSVYEHHYQRMAVQAFDDIQQRPDLASLKKYCYALRAILSMSWVQSNGTPPPMDMPSLMKQALPLPIIDMIHKLIAFKVSATEKENIPRNDLFDNYIKQFVDLTEKPQKPLNQQKLIEHADRLFQQFIY